MLLGVITEAGELESGASSFSATLETVALTSASSVAKEQEAGDYFPMLLFSLMSPKRKAAAVVGSQQQHENKSGGPINISVQVGWWPDLSCPGVSSSAR